MNDFKAGDVVQLKSGGEWMTVESVDGDDVDCVWSEGKKAARMSFTAATLQKVDTTPAFATAKVVRG